MAWGSFQCTSAISRPSQKQRRRAALIGARRLASCFQMHTWWVVGPLGLSAVLLRGVFGRRGSHRRGKRDEDATREEGGLAFSCERVCTSEALLKRLGSLAKVRPQNHTSAALPGTRLLAQRQELCRACACAGSDAQHVCHGLWHVRCAC